MSRLKAYPSILLLLAISGLLVVWSLSQPWVSATIADGVLPVEKVVVTGSTIYPLAVACGWIALASVLAVAAIRGVARVVLGVVVVLAALGVLANALGFALSPGRDALTQTSISATAQVSTSTSQWWIVSAVAALVFGYCGIATIRWGRTWRTLSARQDGNAAADRPARSDWEALDRGEDPTAEQLPSDDHAAFGDFSTASPVKPATMAPNKEDRDDI